MPSELILIPNDLPRISLNDRKLELTYLEALGSYLGAFGSVFVAVVRNKAGLDINKIVLVEV